MHKHSIQVELNDLINDFHSVVSMADQMEMKADERNETFDPWKDGYRCACEGMIHRVNRILDRFPGEEN